ncbi:MAG: glycoside hydrolase family 57 protein [Cyclobacteriaceae bacterium]
MSLPRNTKNRYLNIYFQVHQPRRLGQFSFFDIGTDRDYFDDGANQLIMRRVAKECYLPTNLLLLKLIDRNPQVRITFSISGSALKQMERFAPAAIESFRMLAATGSVEFLSETYYHSLACLVSPDEFAAQVKMHCDKIQQLLGVKPTVFRNTELIYSDDIGRTVSNLGFTGIFTDGVDSLLNDRSPHHLYEHPDKNGLKLFFRNYKLSDDIAFRFTQKEWKAWPLTPKKYVQWLESIPEKENLITLSLDYETFGEHQKKETGIFKFLEGMIASIAAHKKYKMVTPSEAIALLSPIDTISVPNPTSWADQEHDLSAWLGNEMQQDAFETIKNLELLVKKTNDPVLLNTWRYLQTSDHFYYMSTKTGDDGNVHNYFSPYASPYEAFMNYMNVVSDFSLRVNEQVRVLESSQEPNTNLTVA